METGYITRIISDRGFGFIKCPDGHDVFFHANSVGGTLFENLAVGDDVVFDVAPDRDGRRRAVGVQVIPR